MNKRLLFTLSFMFVCHLIFSQKEANIWYFGDNAGIDFSSGKPVALKDGNMYASEGCVSQSTYSGRLLFYTDGNTIWDSTHNIMPNGKDLLGSTSSTQSSLILPKPFSFTRFFVFTADNVGGNEGICYSEVDMSYNKGKGDVIARSKNKKLYAPSCEKLTAIKHANGIDYWVISHQFNSDLIYAYLVTGYGVVKWPVISKTGFIVSGDYSNTLGYMKCSPDGRKLAYANYTMDSVVIADFDASTGKVSNPWVFANDDAYGLEFSAKSRYLYVSEFSTKKIFQYDAKALNRSDFIASQTLADSNYSDYVGALQLGPDGRIYIAVTGSKYLQVIHNPDTSASLINSQKDFIYLGGRSSLLGLPNFSPYIFNRKTIAVQRNCINDTARFYISNLNDIDSVKWYFGDFSSGAGNTSKQMIGATHVYKKTGYYWVTLFYYYKKTMGWTSTFFYVRNPKPYIGKDTGFCNAFTLTLAPQRTYAAYLWNYKQSTSGSITISEKGTYILRITDSAGCSASDTALISNPTVKADFTISDTALCAKNNVFSFRDRSNYDGDAYGKSEWDFGDGTNLTDPEVKKQYAAAGTYKVKLKVESIHHCTSSIERSITVIPNPVAGFSANSPCFPGDVQFSNTSSISSGKIISSIWDFGDKTGSIETHPVKSYSEPGKYNIRLLVISDKGCADSIFGLRGVTVRDVPKAAFSFSEVSALNNGKRVIQFRNLSSADALQYTWDFGKGRYSSEKEPVLNYIDSGMNVFKLMVTNAEGCSDTFSLTTYHKFYFNLPNAFSPDGNHINETFGPVSSLFVNAYKMEIFNRWGEKLFETTDISQGWDGNYAGNPCPDGVYICKITITPFNGVLEHFEDSFRLLR